MQRGSLKRIKNRRGVNVWRLQWRENGAGRTHILGRCCDLSLPQAKAEAKKILAPLNAKIATAAAPSSVTLRRYVEDEYLTAKTRKWKASTSSTTEQIVKDHILSAFGHRAIPTITRKELQGHLDSKAEAGLSFSVVAHTRSQLVGIFAMASGDGIITVNPTQGLVTPKCKGTTDKRTISLESMQRAQMVLQIRERLIFRLAVCEGMRPGEIEGLQVGDLRQDGMIHVERRIYRGKVDSPKSRRSRRPIPPTAITRQLLNHWLELLTDSGPSAWLFPSETGHTAVRISNLFRRRIQPALDSIGLGDVNFQVLRRTWVTEFSEVEKDPNVRAQLAGHSVDVHENEYRQAQPAALRRAMRKLDKRLQ
jgi:integrase